MPKAKIKVMVGAVSLVYLLYWILALNFALPGFAFFHDAYLSTHMRERRGPWPFWVLSLCGLLLIWWGLADLGIAEEIDLKPDEL